jgi:hypothetical protein
MQLCVNRKLIAIRWMNGWTARVELSKRKADEGAERSFRHRKRRRGQRVGKPRSREGKSRTPRPARPLDPNSSRARYVNHVGRKFIWYERTASKIATSGSFQRLEGLDLVGQHPPNEVRKGRDWLFFNKSCLSFLRRAKATGAGAAYENRQFPSWEFLKTRSRAGGDLFSFLGHIGRELPAQISARSGSGVAVSTKRGVICRLCGFYMLPYEQHGARLCPKKGGSQRGVRRGGPRRGPRSGRGRGAQVH